MFGKIEQKAHSVGLPLSVLQSAHGLFLHRFGTFVTIATLLLTEACSLKL